MSLPSTGEVLIVGAGPAGLTLALALKKHGCPDVVLVDAQLQGENTSRALAIHAATIETLRDLDLGDRVVQEGRKLNRTSVWAKNHGEISMASFPSLGKYTKYPFILAIPQHVTERVLEDAAKERGISIHRPFKVANMKANAQDANLTDVTFEDGQVLRARCVIGADGARSTVRKLLNIGWEDPSGEANPNASDQEAANMIVADVSLSEPPPLAADAINLVLTPENALIFIYMTGNPYPEANTSGSPVYRVATGIPPVIGAPPPSPDTEYLQRLLDAWGPNAVVSGAPRVKIERTFWSSRFRTHSAIAARYVGHLEGGSGAVCLLGDAAHIHPPMGGQGMNLGMRDAAKLAPVLAAYVAAARAIGASASQEGLETWGAQRRRRALEVIAFVKSLQGRLWIGTEKKYFLGFIPYDPGWLQLTMMKVLSSISWFTTRNAWRVSGLADP